MIRGVISARFLSVVPAYSLLIRPPSIAYPIRGISFKHQPLSFQSYRKLHASAIHLKITPYLLADVGEGITECEVIQWFVKEGDRVEEFGKIAEVQSDKAAVEISSRFDGVVKKLHYNIGQMARVGAPLVDIDVEGAEEEEATSTPVSTPEAPTVAKSEVPNGDSRISEEGERVLSNATPAVRRIAKENNIDLSKVKGSHKSGRILKEDVIAYMNGEQKTGPAVSTPAASVPAPVATPAAPVVPGAGDKLVQLTQIQKAMFRQMTKSLSIPHFGYSDELVLNKTSEFRNTINQSLKDTPHQYPFKKMSYMPIFMKALSLALREYPILNVMVVDESTIQYRAAHNIAIAMDTPQGLVVPNIKNVESKSIFEIATELERLKELGKKGSLSPSDFANGTITLSNIGTIGGTVLHPVIVSSQVSIGAIGKTQRLPRFETSKDSNGKNVEHVVAHEIMNVSWNADHRVVDGATMARFVQKWKNYVENPMTMIVDLK